MAKKTRKKTTKKKTTKKPSPAQIAARKKFAAAAKARAKAARAGKKTTRKKTAKKTTRKKTAKKLSAGTATMRNRKSVKTLMPVVESLARKLKEAQEGERELARKLVDARSALKKKRAPCKPKAAKKTVKKGRKTVKAAPKKKGEGTVSAEKLIRGAGGRTTVKGIVSQTSLKGVGRRAKPQKVWVCAGPTYTGCGGGKRTRQGSRMIGHITDPRTIRRLK